MTSTKIRTFGVSALLIAISGCSGRLNVSDRSRGGTGGMSVDDPGGDGSGGFAEGGTPGSGGAPSAGGASTGGATMAHVPWMGNSPQCPASPPASGDVCHGPEGTDCGYYVTQPDTGSDVYSGCSCLDAGTTLVWDCPTNSVGPAVCPHDAEPATGSSCFGFKGALCAYPPRTACYCDPNAAAPLWFCIDPNIVLPGPTAPLETAKAVRDMSDADQQAFCTWFATAYLGPGFPLPPDVPPSPDGMSGNTGCGFGTGLACQAKYPLGLPVPSCKANLALSTCAAPLADLIDCAVTVFNVCSPSPHGCGRYLASPGCSGTIMTKHDLMSADGSEKDPDRGNDCGIRVR